MSDDPTANHRESRAFAGTVCKISKNLTKNEFLWLGITTRNCGAMSIGSRAR